MISVKPGSYGSGVKSQQHLYVDSTGKEILNMENVTGRYNGYAPVNFINGLAYLRNGYEFTIFNKQGKILANRVSALSVEISENYSMLPLPERSMAVKHVYDHQWNEVKLPQRPNALVEFVFLEDKYVGIYTLDTITRAFGFELLDPEENKTVYASSKVVMDVEDGFVLIGDPRENKLLEIEDFTNKVIFGVSPESRVFESFKEALLLSDKVFHIKLADENALNYLCGLSNLRTIEINRYKGKSIPVCIGYLQHLKELRIYNSATLESIPKSLPKAPLLERIAISDCPLVDNLEEVIEECKGLKFVTLLNMNLDQAFIDRMKKERPALNISSWVSTDGN
jgi:Leucine-rich repeat (LRR) protein